MAAALTVHTDDLSNEKPSEDGFQIEPPSYQQLFGNPNISHNFQYPPQSVILMDNYQCRQLFVSTQVTPSQPIYCIKSHIVWSVFNILCCCCCFGYVACCFSLRTKDLKKQGDAQGALLASKKARKWNMFTSIIGIILVIIGVIFFITVHL